MEITKNPIMDDHNNKAKYYTNAEELYTILNIKFQLSTNQFSPSNLSNSIFKLKRKNIVSYDTINKLLNVPKTLTHNKVEPRDIHELKALIERINKFNSGDIKVEGKLNTIFKKLSMQSKDAIINENEFDLFKEYMHIERPIEQRFSNKILNHVIPNKKSLLFLVGNVGDGKSHLLSYIQKKNLDNFINYDIKIHKDATETNSPKNTAIETLLEILQPYSDSELNNGVQNRLIVAINVGVLTNLMKVMEESDKFSQLFKYINSTNVTNNRKIVDVDHNYFDFVSFREDSNFEYDGDNLSSYFYSEALKKVFAPSKENPFFVAYRDDIENGIEEILHYNYEFMLREEFQNSLIYLLIRAEIENQAIISARDLFNLFYDICSPRDDRQLYDSYLPYLLFDNSSKSSILTIMNHFDPAKLQTRKIDETAIHLYHATDTYDETLKLLKDEKDNFSKIFESFKTYKERFDDFFNTYLRIKYLLNYHDDLFDNEIFNSYIQAYHNIQRNGNYREMMLLINRAMERWYGESPKENHIVRNTNNSNIKLILGVKLKPAKPYVQQSVIIFPFEFRNGTHLLEIDYQVFRVLKQVDAGYFLKNEDYQIAVQFDRFVNHYLYSQNLLEENYLFNLDSNTMYKLSDNYGQIKLNTED